MLRQTKFFEGVKFSSFQRQQQQSAVLLTMDYCQIIIPVIVQLEEDKTTYKGAFFQLFHEIYDAALQK